ncbi:MAG: GIY-YIG nuclease family protein [Bacteroidales bacterium]|jgi:putative endonuclease|nr:GIY-YIG nuclease family protein [Bacteroidales bacterium]MCK9613291.1 GIY-YIG nuclease family protein [Bacteroidales bacterium]MDD4214832.1 GIY-YIG nuclease family protein [Bacteroidales bacterium]
MYYVYVIQSENYGKRYTGFTKDLYNRINEHNNGNTKSIKPYIPYKLIYFETVENIALARTREKYLKSAAGRRFIKKINPDGSEARLNDFSRAGLQV